EASARVVGRCGRLATFFVSLPDGLDSTVLLTLTPIFTIRVKRRNRGVRKGSPKAAQRRWLLLSGSCLLSSRASIMPTFICAGRTKAGVLTCGRVATSSSRVAQRHL